eukprot:CAMPEP_0171106066 /NCGR_PEP_ID=MMETSP0766_2-20121228/63977_1 /TAXON_ID=439317 /ORGANISM="Gambierdiscus australes, Strain CAWD 149" /LENGTH=279 /DNA_ID=CAMNT_0011567065 /DNA_START=107 /DNA_END=943 /DNA_ORIENTATION=+
MKMKVMRSRGTSGVRPFNEHKDHALVYSLGKVGSTTMWIAITYAFRYYEYSSAKQQNYSQIFKTHDLPVAKDYMQKCPVNKTNGTIWIFVSIREPFRRLMSMYFEDIEMDRWKYTNTTTNYTNETLRSIRVGELHRDFPRWYWSRKRVPSYETFFEKDLYQVSGVNLLNYTFPVDEGKLVVEGRSFGKPVVVVLLRYEEIARWKEIMRPLVWWWEMSHQQDASQLFYYDKYQEFVQTYRWPKDLAEDVMQGNSIHFYSPEERQAALQRALGENSLPVGA